MKNIFSSILLVTTILLLVGCSRRTSDFQEKSETTGFYCTTEEVTENVTEVMTEETQTESIVSEETESTRESLTSEPEQSKRYLVVIDPGHQRKRNAEKEPVGPGATTMKAKVSSGTAGRTTGLPEYELNLQVALKVKDILEEKGYEVVMTRDSHDVDISNSERAAIANEADADAFVRIHANGSENSSVNGALTICQTKSNPYNGDLYEESKALSACVLDGVVKYTGAKKRKIWETDTMSGINWAMVPTTIIEMGYMTNAEEDLKLATEEYQHKVAEGIAEGIELFLEE